jgi:hypothetical protein
VERTAIVRTLYVHLPVICVNNRGKILKKLDKSDIIQSMRTVFAPRHEWPQEERGVLLPPDALPALDKIERGETDSVSSWHSSAIERPDLGPMERRGLFALEDIPENKLIAIKRRCDLSDLTQEEVLKNLVGYNHSDDPNARIILPEGVSLEYVVTSRSIAAGEEVTVDLLGGDRV